MTTQIIVTACIIIAILIIVWFLYEFKIRQIEYYIMNEFDTLMINSKNFETEKALFESEISIIKKIEGENNG